MFKEREAFFSLSNSEGFDVDSYSIGMMMNNRSDFYSGNVHNNNNNFPIRRKHVPSSLPSSGDDEASISPSNSFCVGSGSQMDSEFGLKNSERLSLMSSPSGGNNNNMRCYGCGQVILARYYVFAMDHHFHNECLKCHLCNSVLSEEPTCFEKDGRILCKQDYYRLYNKTSPKHPRRCARCTNQINSNDLVMRACDLVYHVDCFVCTICHRTFSRGDQFRMQSTDLFCRLHYDMVENFNTSEEFPSGPERPNLPPVLPNNKSNPSNNNKRGRPPKRKLLSGVQDKLKESDPSLDYFHPVKPPSLGLSNIGSMNAEFNQIMDSPINGFSMGSLAHHHSDIGGVTMNMHGDGTQAQQKGKRMRTTFKHNQLRVMKSYFDMNPNPDTKDLKQLSQKTGLCKRVLQVWFQNARAKHRRTCPRSESSLSGGGVLHLDDSEEWSPPPTFQPPSSELNNNSLPLPPIQG